MSAIELSEQLERAGIKKGERRNPLGKQRPGQHRRSTEIRRALFSELSERCEVPGFEHLSKWDYGIYQLIEEFQKGTRWAIVLVFNRLYGRIPLSIELK